MKNQLVNLSNDPGETTNLFDQAEYGNKEVALKKKILNWPQIAIGLRASRVEALEKPHASDVFTRYVISQATYRHEDRRFAMKTKSCSGFKVDQILIKHKANSYFFI